LTKKILVIKHKNIILPYSDKKIIAKPPPAYSVLNPETNSDSPSAKSNGARFTSADIKAIQQINQIGDTKTRNQLNFLRKLTS
jgi:hypothetical protein